MTVMISARAKHWEGAHAADSLMLTATRIGAGDNIEPASNIWRDPVLALQPASPARVRGRFDVVVEVAYCGICGSDLSCSHRGPDGRVTFGGPMRAPVVPGHEFTGRIIAKGEAVTDLELGEAITAESISACHTCPECIAGHYNECQGGVELVGLTRDGAFAPTVRVDARHCYSIKPLIDSLGNDKAMEVGTLLEPLGNALRGLTRARLSPADRLLVVGAGPIGLGAVALARQAGVQDIVVVERSPSRRSLAMALGATFVSAALDEGALATLWNGCRATLAFEAAGNEEALQTAVNGLGPRGRMVALGRMPGPVTTDQNYFMTMGLEVIYSRGHAGYGFFPKLIQMIATGDLDIFPLITARFPFSDIHRAFEHARSAVGGKTIVQIGEAR